jgi:MFS family permease
MTKIAGIMFAVVAVVFASIWTYYASGWLLDALSVFEVGGPISKAGGPRVDSWDQASRRYYILLMLAPILAIGGIAYCLITEPLFARRVLVYVAVLAVLLPLNVFNYAQYDTVLSATLQAFLNLVTIFLGAVITLVLLSARVEDIDARVAKAMATILILSAAVLAPGFFTLLWALEKIGILTLATTRAITWQDITAASGVISTVVTVAKTIYEMRKERHSQTAGARRDEEPV